jgi:hypothetical protein
MMKNETVHLEERPKRSKSSEVNCRKPNCMSPPEYVKSEADNFNNDFSEDFLFSYRPTEGQLTSQTE